MRLLFHWILGSFIFLSQAAVAGGAIIDRNALVTPDIGSSNGHVDAKLVRNKNVLSMSGRAFDLVGGNTYTLWWIIPGSGMGPVPLVVNTTGGIANPDGELAFGGVLPTGSYVMGDDTPRLVLQGGTLNDPKGVTVVIHIVDHGPPIPGVIPKQISEINAAGCPTGCFLATEFVFP